jgi:hypothetical protein
MFMQQRSIKKGAIYSFFTPAEEPGGRFTGELNSFTEYILVFLCTTVLLTIQTIKL